MKKFLLTILAILTSISINAQSQKCNRLFLHQKGESAAAYNMKKIDSISFGGLGISNNLNIHNSNGQIDRYAIDNIDSLTFKNIEGKVAAEVNIIDYSTSHVKFDITRTASCKGFMLMCMDYGSIISLSSDDLAKYISENAAEVYYQDFEGVEINDLSLDHNTEYAIVTVGLDEYDLPCDVTKAKFVTRASYLEGNPEVMVEVTKNELNEDNFCDFTLKLTPNSETSKYSVFVAEAGVTDYQFIMFKAKEGWKNLGDMIEGWGYEFSGNKSQQYPNEVPGALYEVYIQAQDVNGTRAPYQVFRFRTQGLGGEGVASVDIKLGEYVLAEWVNENLELELKPSQFFTFTPNDQTNAYRFDVMLESTYESDIDGIQEELCSDPFMPTDGWFMYETITTDYQIDPGLKCVAIAAAKNSLGEWGPVTELYFTTPDKAPGEEDEEANLELKVDKNSILANGKDVATFTVKLNGKTLESGYLLSYVELDALLTDNQFHTTEVGTYTFVAKYNGISSNEVKIEAVSDAPTGIQLIADKTKIKNTGTDKVAFTVLVNGVDATAEATIFNVTDNKNLDGSTFSSTEIGTYIFNASYNDLTSENITVTVKEARVYAPGDLYNEDGVEGVVFYVTDGGTSGYIMSLDQAELQWSTENIQANCFSGNGKYNTEDMLKLGADKFPAAKWCADHGNGWFMPSSTELEWMWDAVSNKTHVFDNEFIKLYNDKLEDPILEDYYWSSNEITEVLGELVAFMENSVICLDPQKTKKYSVRAVYKF